MVNTYKTICVEDLNIKSMLQSGWKHLNRNICDCAWNNFIQMLSYKAEEAGSIIIKVNPANTSKICSRCGTIVDKQLSASLNILRIGLYSLGNQSIEATG